MSKRVLGNFPAGKGTDEAERNGERKTGKTAKGYERNEYDVKKWLKKFSITLTVIFAVICAVSFGATTAFADGYNGAAAGEWGRNNYTNNYGKCAEFVWNCVNQGGLSIAKKTRVVELRQALLDTGMFEEYEPVAGTKIQASKNPGKLAVGDIVIYQYKNNGSYEHTAIITDIIDDVAWIAQRNPSAYGQYAAAYTQCSQAAHKSGGTCDSNICWKKGTVKTTVLHYTGPTIQPTPAPPDGDTCSTDYAGWYVTTSADTLMLRAGHGGNTADLDEIPRSTVIYITKASGPYGVSGNWGHTTYNGKEGCVAMRYVTPTSAPTYSFDLNGFVDGVKTGHLGDGGNGVAGICDVYLNGQIVSEGLNDYVNNSVAAGTTYEIRNIRAVNGYTYDGVYSGALSGTINGNTEVVLTFNKEKEPPVISDVKVTQADKDGYTVQCTVTDNVGVNRVQFPTWTDTDGQDDIQAEWWTNTAASGHRIDGTNTWEYRVNASDHGDAEDWYTTHIYAYDDAENNTANNEVRVYVDKTPPVIEDIQIKDITTEGYTVRCKVTDASKDVAKVLFPTWTDANGQDDLAADWNTTDAVKGTAVGDGYYEFRVNVSDHNGEYGRYKTHIYAWDSFGNQSDVRQENEALNYIMVPAPTVASGYCGTDVTWNLAEDGTLTILGKGDMKNYGMVSQTPWYNYKEQIKAVVISDGVTRIGNFAFNSLPNLESVSLPATTARIGDYSFKNCVNLNTVQWSEGLAEIGESAFYGCAALTDVEMPDTLTSIGTYAFKGCTSLKNVKISNSLKKISESLFYGCTSLTNISIPEGVTAVDGYVFKNCENLAEVSLPSSLTKLGESAFYGCKKLTAIVIPKNVPTIGSYTFKACTALADVTLPANLKGIGESAFYGCTALQHLTIPSKTTTINDYAFKNCTALAEVELPDGLTKLGESAFYASKLASLTIPDSVASIGDYAFKNCADLAEIKLPASLTKIGESVFYGCAKLTHVEIPENVVSIGSYAFRKCTGLQQVGFPAALQTVGESSFYGCTALTSIALPDQVTTIKGYAFKTCTALEDVTLPQNLQEIGESAFYGCTRLGFIEIPAGVVTIGDYAYSQCSGLGTIWFTGNAPAIGSYAFSKVTADAYYPNGNETWTEDKKQNYGGQIQWHSDTEIASIEDASQEKTTEETGETEMIPDPAATEIPQPEMPEQEATEPDTVSTPEAEPEPTSTPEVVEEPEQSPAEPEESPAAEDEAQELPGETVESEPEQGEVPEEALAQE